MENSLFQLGKILTVSMISTMGTYAIAANAVCNTIASFNILPGAAINSGIVAIVSVCIGAGKPEQARYYSKKLMKADQPERYVFSAYGKRGYFDLVISSESRGNEFGQAGTVAPCGYGDCSMGSLVYPSQCIPGGGGCDTAHGGIYRLYVDFPAGVFLSAGNRF